VTATCSIETETDPMPTLQTDHARIEYQRTGRGPAVLFIQGVGVVGEGWRPQLEALCDRFTVVSFDNRGIGGSSAPRGALAIETMAEDARAIMQAEGLESYHVVGHSMGGLIAQALALAAPVRVRSLALLCTFARGVQGARPTMAMLPTALRTRLGTRRMRRHAFLELVLPRAQLAGADRDALAERLRPLFGHDLADQPPVVMRQLGAMARFDAGARLSRLAAIPTLVVAGAHDRIALPRYGRQLAAAIPGARLVELPEAAHGVPLHDPATINDLLRAHFEAADAPTRRRAAP
jgi:aminoacrylate hydrolase